MASASTNCYESPWDFYFWTWSSRRSHLFLKMQVHHTAEVLLAVQIHFLYFHGFIDFPIAWKSEIFFLLIFCLIFFKLNHYLMGISACSQYHQIATNSPLMEKSGPQSCSALLYKMKFHFKSFHQLLRLTVFLPLWHRDQKRSRSPQN